MNEQKPLESFIGDVCENDYLRVQEDLGYGYVRLNHSEAERRQAAQDIRTSEDAIIELLRNSRDAHASNIFVASYKNNTKRCFTIIDDGDGIPIDVQEIIFDPRVTSKLNTFHIDKWGVHGRGMALYSIKTNADVAKVITSARNLGTSIFVQFDLNHISEKSDQSQFPYFEINDNNVTIRGTKNILRTIVEFAIEEKNSLNVYFGSPTEIACTLYKIGFSNIDLNLKDIDISKIPICNRLCYSSDESELSSNAKLIGLDFSERSAARIMNGDIKPLMSINSLVSEIILNNKSSDLSSSSKSHKIKNNEAGKLNLDQEDIEMMYSTLNSLYARLAEKYYFDKTVEFDYKIINNKLVITANFFNNDN